MHGRTEGTAEGGPKCISQCIYMETSICLPAEGDPVRATFEVNSECERKRKRGEASDTQALESLRRGIQRSISLHTIHERKVLTCEGGSKEDRDEDPLRRAKVYIQCTRMHMEERVCGVRD